MSLLAALLPCLLLPPVREAAPPTPFPGIAVRLQSADQFLRARQIPECIRAAQETIKEAKAQTDKAGEAQAHEMLAVALLEVPLPENQRCQ